MKVPAHGDNQALQVFLTNSVSKNAQIKKKLQKALENQIFFY
jgi:hypothetical protein